MANAKAISGHVEVGHTLTNAYINGNSCDWVVTLPADVTYEGYNDGPDIAACDDNGGSASAGAGYGVSGNIVVCEIYSIAGSSATAVLTFRFSID